MKPAKAIMSGDAAEGKTNSRIERIRRTYPKLSQNSLHLRPKLFKGIQVRAVRRQIKGLRSGITEQLPYRYMVSPEIVHYHNIAASLRGVFPTSLLSYHSPSLIAISENCSNITRGEFAVMLYRWLNPAAERLTL